MEGAQEPMSTTRAEAEIGLIMQEVAVIGANDVEIPQLQELISKVHNGDISPAEALKQAHGIKNRKASYH